MANIFHSAAAETADAHDAAVEAELEMKLMQVVCAWHAKNFGVELVMREAAPGHEQDDASHGICDECYALLRKKVEEKQRKAKAQG